MNTKKISIISLGCSKNLIDSERLAAMLAARGLDVSFVDEVLPDGSVYVVNTCGFIGDAKEESVGVLLEAVRAREEGEIAAVYGMGCLTERYRKDLEDEMPELDGIFGKFDWTALADTLAPEAVAPAKAWTRKRSTASHYTYLKISEGCNRFCAFCAIPLITGRHHSRKPEDILEEVRALVADGVKEFNVIAQDLSSYGRDLNDDSRSLLAALVDDMASIEGVEMIRLHYAYPADFPMDVLDVMAAHPNVCRYLDIALQHIDDGVLANMRRHIDAAATRALLDEIRRRVPGIHIRTTMMVGFPGEDEAAFERLKDFIREQRFERMGAFAYCEEDDTYAARHLTDDIPAEVKQQRLDELMAIQQDIAFEIAESKVGTDMTVIVDACEGDRLVCRSEFDSPEVDCCVFVGGDESAAVGDIINVHITGAEGFDLVGKRI